MKKIVSLAISASLVASTAISAYAARFSDLPSDHWAYTYVDTLVNAGTINGFEDGTFRPSGTVTRAEFVKMIGNGPTRREKDFEDVSPEHWAYEYIMTSGLGSENDTMFNPSTPITRGEVAVMLWQRAGAVTGTDAPEEIYTQGDNRDAISWVYTNGIMTGNDNVNLRLGDTLTRAEASALIIRSRDIKEKNDETQEKPSVSEDFLKVAYDAYKVVTKEYSSDAKLTNGELALAAGVIQSGTNIIYPTVLAYPGLTVSATFNHKYATPINMVCRYALGLENDNASFADKNATVGDSVAALMFAAKAAVGAEIEYDENGDTYPGTENENELKLSMLKCAYQNGVTIDADFNSEITLADFTNLLIQMDALSGFQRVDHISDEASILKYKLNTDISAYPSNASKYAKILDGIENYVYETPFVNEFKTPAEAFEYTNQLHEVFNSLAIDWQKTCAESGIKIALIHNPTLILQSTTGFTFRTQIEIIEKGKANTLADIVKCADETIGAKALENGDKF